MGLPLYLDDPDQDTFILSGAEWPCLYHGAVGCALPPLGRGGPRDLGDFCPAARVQDPADVPGLRLPGGVLTAVPLPGRLDLLSTRHQPSDLTAVGAQLRARSA